MIEMTSNSYGKSDVRLMKVIRGPERHQIVELTANIRLQGELEASYTDGDNTDVLPTDTIKNTVYALAKKVDFDTPEEFALLLARHYVASQPQIERAEVELSVRPWEQMKVSGSSHPSTFEGTNGERRTVFVDHSAEDTTLEAGVRDLVILKSANSGFSNFVEDEYTTLEEIDDRVLCTRLEATWTYANVEMGSNVEFLELHDSVRATLLEVFAEHQSLSVQHTLYAMGETALEEFSALTEIHISMPNVHNLPVDLDVFGMDNDHEILKPIDEPSGVIEATLRRE